MTRNRLSVRIRSKAQASTFLYLTWLAAVDEEMVSLALINWGGEVFNTRGIYIAINTASRLVIGQLVYHGKANETTAVPELGELLEIKGSTITIDAIGATENIMNAEEMLDHKRKHWTIENCLHYVLDEILGEDKSTIKLGKNSISLLRKCAYNIARLLQMENLEEQGGIPDIIDNVCDNLEIGLQMIFSRVPSRY